MGDVFKDLIWKSLVDVALKKIFEAAPILGWGPFGIIVTWLVNFVADQLFDKVELFVNLQMIVFRNKELAKKYAAAAVSLKKIGSTQGIDSEEFKRERELHKKSLSEFIHFNGG